MTKLNIIPLPYDKKSTGMCVSCQLAMFGLLLEPFKMQYPTIPSKYSNRLTDIKTAKKKRIMRILKKDTVNKR